MDDEGAPKEDVFMIGHTKACAEDKCEELETEGAEEEEEAEEGAPKENPVVCSCVSVCVTHHAQKKKLTHRIA